MSVQMMKRPQGRITIANDKEILRADADKLAGTESVNPKRNGWGRNHSPRRAELRQKNVQPVIGMMLSPAMIVSRYFSHLVRASVFSSR